MQTVRTLLIGATLLLLALPLAAQTPTRHGDFYHRHYIDPITDSDGSAVISAGLNSAGLALSWFCLSNDEVDFAIIRSAGLVGDDNGVGVVYRFDSLPPSGIEWWELGVQQNIVLAPPHVRDEFTRAARSASRVAVRVFDFTPASNIHTAVFSLRGLNEALDRLTCMRGEQ
jgi:hypothetical protein